MAMTNKWPSPPPQTSTSQTTLDTSLDGDKNRSSLDAKAPAATQRSWATLVSNSNKKNNDETATPSPSIPSPSKPRQPIAKTQQKQPHALSPTSQSPRSFQFGRGSGVVITHEISESPPRPSPPVADTRNEVVQGNEHHSSDILPALIKQPHHAPAAALSWAERAKAAAAAAPAPPLQKNNPPATARATSTIDTQSKNVRRQSSSPQHDAQQHGRRRKSGNDSTRTHTKDVHRQPHHQRQQQQQHGRRSKGTVHENTAIHSEKHPASQRQQQRQQQRQEQPSINVADGNREDFYREPSQITNKVAALSIGEDKGKTQMDALHSHDREMEVSIVGDMPGIENGIDLKIKTDKAENEEEQEDNDNDNDDDEKKEEEEAMMTPLKAFLALCATTTTTPSFLNASTSTSAMSAIEPRGIQNPGNLCFVNAVLQALLGSDGFRVLMLHLRLARQYLSKDDSPVLTGLSDISSEFEKKEGMKQISPRKGQDKLKTSPSAASVLGGRPLKSALIMELIYRFASGQGDRRHLNSSSALNVEQEDAHEFLHFMLDAVHDELLALGKLPLKSGVDDNSNQSTGLNESAAVDNKDARDDHTDSLSEHRGNFEGDKDNPDDGWLVQSGKRAVKQQEVSATKENNISTAISALFQGKLATSVACSLALPSVTVHPFKVLGLPIGNDSVRSVYDAIDELTANETISGYRPAGSTQLTEATKTERFQQLPEVFILHLMRFQFTGRSAKLNKFITYDPKLQVRSSWLAPGSKERGSVYELVATVTHHGKNIGNGHYTADVVQSLSSVCHQSSNGSGSSAASKRWLRFDDGNVFIVKPESVFNDKPYLLVYQKIQKK